MVVVSEWQVVIDDKFYEMGPLWGKGKYHKLGMKGFIVVMKKYVEIGLKRKNKSFKISFI